jgi:hypothetical protein
MRFLCLYRPGTAESNEPPTEENMAAMGNLIGEMSKSGRAARGRGLLAELEELIAGFCMLQIKSKPKPSNGASSPSWAKARVRSASCTTRRPRDTSHLRGSAVPVEPKA